MNHFRSKMLTEFKTFMASTHGATWLEDLAVLRRLVKSRRRLGGIDEKKEGKRKRTKGYFPEQPPVTGVQRELGKDARAGLDAIGKVADSTW